MFLATNYNYLVALGSEEHQESLSEQIVFSVFINLTGSDHREKAKPPNHLHTFSYLDSSKVGGNWQRKCITRQDFSSQGHPDRDSPHMLCFMPTYSLNTKSSASFNTDGPPA